MNTNCWRWELDVQFPRARATFPRCSACGLEIQTPSLGVPQQFSWGGGFLFLHFGCAISPTTFTTHFTLREHVAISSKARSIVCSELTHHLHHPVLPIGSRGGLGERARAAPRACVRARTRARTCAFGGIGEGSGRDRGGIGEGSGRDRGGVGEGSRRYRGGIGERARTRSRARSEGSGARSEGSGRDRGGIGERSGKVRGGFGEGSGRDRGGVGDGIGEGSGRDRGGIGERARAPARVCTRAHARARRGRGGIGEGSGSVRGGIGDCAFPCKVF